MRIAGFGANNQLRALVKVKAVSSEKFCFQLYSMASHRPLLGIRKTHYEESNEERGYLSGDIIEGGDVEHQDYPLHTSCSSESCSEEDDFDDPPMSPEVQITPSTTHSKSKKSTSTPHGRTTAPVASLRQNIYKRTKVAVGSKSSEAQGEGSLTSVLSELTQTLNKVVERMDNQEKRMKSMEKQLEATSYSAVSSSSSCESKKEKVPLVVRVS